MDKRIEISKSPILNKAQYEQLSLDERTTFYQVEENIFKPINSLTNEELQAAKDKSQKRELFFFNRASLFNIIVENLESEAESRGIELQDIDTDYHKKRRHVKRMPPTGLSGK